MVTKMREKGQITIPANIRESLHLSRNSVLSVARIGDGILLTPRPSVFESVSEKFSKAAKIKEITLDNLLKDLKKNRHQES
ncbi:MAG: AbrB/MazE/SpoVT family DNA-binding domain-containing protein [Candidatus Omnitrophica bacterium]|nr:AbrB/MazE/SpoVT family DNA-binding domain-containing protein [Candidatus Omnitrophota bacterium]